MNENKSSRFMAPEVWWPKESQSFSQSEQRSTVPNVPRAATPFFPQAQYNTAGRNFSQDMSLNVKQGIPEQNLTSSNNMTASNPFEIHSTAITSGTTCVSLPYNNAPIITSVHNVHQINSPNLCPNNLKQSTPPHFSFPCVYPNTNPPHNTTISQVPSNVSSNCTVQVSNVPFNIPHCNYNFNGYSSGEQINMINHASSTESISTESVMGKVPFHNPQTIQKDNSKNWQPYSTISPLTMPTEGSFHMSQMHNSCRPPFNFEVPQNRSSMHTPLLNSMNNSLPAVFPNNIPQCPKPGLVGTTEYNPLVASNKLEEVKDKSYSNLYSNQQNLFGNSSILMVPPPTYSNHVYPPPIVPLSSQNTSITCIPNKNFSYEKEDLLSTFLQKVQIKKKPLEKNKLTVVEFRSALKLGFSLLKVLQICKCNFTKLLQSSESDWDSEMKRVSQMQGQLSEICSMVSSPRNLLLIQEKLKIIKKKREHKKRRKQNHLSAKLKSLEERKNINQEIDKWLDCIKEKNLKLKREAEMKKEADNILSEVRRKIQEAKRTIEKLKVFEKLRSARQASALKKSLFVLPEHNENFDKKVSVLKDTMTKQLLDYEAEEKALKVMLETEQEGQLEEEALWRIKKIKTLQQKRQKNIHECLFDDSEEPTPADPLFLFYKHQDSANSSIENLVQIRHHWDVHLAEDGETIPQQWVSPMPPSNPSWEVYRC